MLLLMIVFFGTLLTSFALALWITRRTRSEKAVQRRVGDIHLARQADKTRQLDAERILKLDEPGKFQWLDHLLDRFQFSKNLKTLLLQTGSAWTIGMLVIYSGAACILTFFATYIFFPAVLLDGLVALLGLMAPTIYLKHRRNRRLAAFNSGLPDAIDLMGRALRAGHSLSSAIEVLSEQSGAGVATEFNVVFRQQNFGLPLRDALLQMADRVPSKDLRFLVTAMLVQKETGGNLTEILDRTAHVIRERIRIGGEVRVKTAQGRLTGTILSLLPVLMLLLTSLINPEYARILLHDPVGHKLLYIGAGLILIGSFFIRRIVDIKV
ncbi:MAG TPA: type II secretion system F family protein [Acidobacteriaceae bacterium]|nr:type II secretion system F family protein [Acidobacteriaceae bacterium]